MASTNVAILPYHGSDAPRMGTLGAAANTYFAKGTLIGRDANGRAYSYVSADASGIPCAGSARASYDNRTTAESGGAADAIDVEVEYGVHGYAFTGTTPKPRDRLYVVDNQTLSTSDNGGTRGFAGICSEVRTINGAAKAYLQLGPQNALGDPAQVSTVSVVDVPVKSAILLATGLIPAAAASGATPGPDATASGEITSIKWAANATPAAIVQSVYMPAPSDPAAPAVVRLTCSKIGATLADATKFTIAAFAAGVGDLHDVSNDFGGDTTAVVGDLATKTIQEVTLTLAGASLPDTACILTLQIKPKAGTLGTDAICLHAVRVTR